MSNDASLAVSSHTVSDYLDCLQVVMVNTTLPANIGSAARAMHTMGLSRLTVVDPKLPIDETSVSHAAGGSELLSSSLITPTLESAISDCQLVFAASSRSRHMPRPVVTPTQAAKIMFDFIDAQAALSADDSNVDTSSAATSNKPNIAILFGREDRALGTSIPAQAVTIAVGDTLEKTELLTSLAKACDFPSYFSHNWDSAWDCLTDSEAIHLRLDLTDVKRINTEDRRSWTDDNKRFVLPRQPPMH